MDDQITSWGWDEDLLVDASSALAGLAPGRVVSAHRGSTYRLVTQSGEPLAELSGKLRHSTVDRSGLPAVGDWVVARPSSGNWVIEEVLPRRTSLVRKASGRWAAEQVIAANVDGIGIVASVDQDRNLRRIERYLAVAWESGAQPMVILNKADIGGAALDVAEAVRSIALGVDVHVISAISGSGFGSFQEGLIPARTYAFVGPSGVGKSTIINRLLGRHAQRTQPTMDDARGRHTTTSRDLIKAPSGALIMDTPGMRELGLIDADVEETFTEIEASAAGCRFSDCSHQREPGCAVLEALEAGLLDVGRYESFMKLKKEAAYEARRRDRRLAAIEKRRWKQITKQMRMTDEEG